MTNRPDVLALFERQFRVASYNQLRELGVSRQTIWRAQRRGSVDAVLPLVYALAGAELTFMSRCMAALLYLGPDSYLCRKTAAAILGCRDMPRQVVHVTIPTTARIGPLPSWIKVHWTSWRLAGDVLIRPDGLRLSSPLRTLFDLAAKLNRFALERVAEDLWHLKLLDPADAFTYLDCVRRSGRGGVARFEEWLERVRLRARPAQSGLELDVIQAIRDIGLPEPERQHPLVLNSGEPIHLDVAWPDIQFGLEPGHSWWHGGDLQVRKDIARDNACGEIGWFIRRLDEALRADLGATARLVKALYDSRRATFRPSP
jgi:hypothetical protein